MAQRQESKWTREDMRGEIQKLRNEVECLTQRGKILAKLLSGYLMKDGIDMKLKTTESERKIIENSRQVVISILEWM